jgi:hypothetical protein
MGAFRVAALSVLGLTFTGALGCAAGLPQCRDKDTTQYVSVRYRVEFLDGVTPRAEVRHVDRFSALRPTWNTVAIRRPDACLNEGAATGTGAMHSAETMLGTDCGFWLAEIERGLAHNKFSIVSWNALNQVEHTKQVPTYVAARDLGADVVFIVNSLQASTISPQKMGFEIGERLSFFESNADGDRLQPLPMNEEETGSYLKFIQNRTAWMRDKSRTTGIVAVLDVTAVDTKTGEAVWFYLKQASKQVETSIDVNFLFANNERGEWPVKPAWIRRMEKEAAQPRAEAEHTADAKRQIVPESAYKAEVEHLTRDVVNNFLQSFRSEGN